MIGKRIANIVVKIVMPLVLGGAILYWMYRNFDFKQVRDVLLDSCGAAVGVLLVLFVTWLIRRSGKKHNSTTGKQELSGRKPADLANKTIDN